MHISPLASAPQKRPSIHQRRDAVASPPQTTLPTAPPPTPSTALDFCPSSGLDSPNCYLTSPVPGMHCNCRSRPQRPRPTDPVLTSDRPVGSPFATGDNCPSLGSSPHLPSKLRPHWSSTSHTGAPDLDPLSSLSTYAL